MSEGRPPNEETIAAIQTALFKEQRHTVLVSGPPGSGKTYLAAQLAVQGATTMHYGQSALVLTFTVNAADQITEEVRKAVRVFGVSGNMIDVLNYHALYRRLLDAYGRYCGLPTEWRTWLPHEARNALRELIDASCSANANANKRRVEWELSNAMAIAAGQLDLGINGVVSGAVLQRAASLLADHHRRGVIDYDSWAHYACRLLSESHTLRRDLGNRHPLIIVDEFQDTNDVEWAFITQLAAGRQLVCMVDPDQAIYQWKGADAHARLAALAREREPEPAAGFRLVDRPRHRERPELARFADAVRSLDCASPVKLDLPAAVSFVPVSRSDRNTDEWLDGYAEEVRRQLPNVRDSGKRVGVLCPTWYVLSRLSHALQGPRGPVRVPHAIAGTDDQVGAFLGALSHALDARLVGKPIASGGAAAELSLEQLIRVARRVRRNACWFGPHGEDLPAAAERRRTKVRVLLSSYINGNSELRDAVEDAQRLARAMCAAMATNLRASTWIAAPVLERAYDAWYHRLTDYVRRRPSALPGELVAEAWRAVEECVARERRVLSRRDPVLMTADAAKGKQFDTTIVCGATGGRRLDARMRGSECAAVRNLWHVACSRSRERVIILFESARPACLLVVLQGDRCPRQVTEVGHASPQPAQLKLFE